MTATHREMNFKAMKFSDKGVKRRCSEVNHNLEEVSTEESEERYERIARQGPNCLRSWTSEVIELPNDGRVEIVASRQFGKHVTSLRDRDEVAITFDHDDVVTIHVTPEQKSWVRNVLQSCGAHIPHGCAVIDGFVSIVMFVYASMLAVLVSYARAEWRYLSIVLFWFFYVILRVNTYKTLGASLSKLKRKIWHFSGISFSIIFMYVTLIVVFPMLVRDVYYKRTTTNREGQVSPLFVMSALKTSVGFALLGMAARRSFHCGKVISHMDIINSLLLGNIDVFNLVETLDLKDGRLPLIAKGSVMEISILVACEVAFLIVALEALMPYSLMTLDEKNVGKLKHNLSLKHTKEKAIVMVYPYALLVQNVPFLVLRVLLFACYDTFQVAYIIKNITSIILGMLMLIRARSSLRKNTSEVKFVHTLLSHRRASV